MNQAEESIFVSLIYLEQRERERERDSVIDSHTHTEKHAQTEHDCVYSHVTLTKLPYGCRHGNESSVCIPTATSLPTPRSPQWPQILPEIHFCVEKCLEIW